MRSLRWRLIVLAVVAAITLAVSAGIASANKPSRGCPDNYTLTPFDPATAPADYVAADKNVDYAVCLKDRGLGNGVQDQPNVIDDTSNH